MEEILRHLRFLKVAAADRKVGAVTMSSDALVRRVAKLLPANLSSVIELGPGEGAMTSVLLRKLKAAGKLVLIEPNRTFATKLRKIDDARLSVIEGKAEESLERALERLPESPQLIIASLPFSFLKEAVREKLVEAMRDALAPGGMCIIFHQYSFLMYPILKKAFGKAKISLEILNVPPCFVMSAKKEGKSRR